ncbi:MAG: DUF763 domain-containing protein [candidate division WOR-3 bacterium]
MRTGYANLPLHYGSAPKWLFARMTKLARAILEIMLGEFGSEEFLRRISDPFWFQSLGCVLGFDWHSSGLTTTLCAALKLGLKDLEKDFGIFIAGGKGTTSRQTPVEIKNYAEMLSFEPDRLIYASRMSAKVDSSALQDGYQIYHHTFFGTKDGKWAVIQQGMNPKTRWARRYHWLSLDLTDFVCEPHKAIVSEKRNNILNLVAKESEPARVLSTLIAKQNPNQSVRELMRIKELSLQARHPILSSDINPNRFEKILLKTYESQPPNFEALLGINGVGPQTIRALALLSEVIYGVKPSYQDPVSYSFAHGGKDGYPYPINRNDYDKSIEILERAIAQAKIGNQEKLQTLKRLARINSATKKLF